MKVVNFTYADPAQRDRPTAVVSSWWGLVVEKFVCIRVTWLSAVWVNVDTGAHLSMFDKRYELMNAAGRAAQLQAEAA